jgi:opacity protein-like surface antigen
MNFARLNLYKFKGSWMKFKLSLFTLLSAPVFAGTMGPVVQDSKINWVGALSIGPTWTSPGSQQTLSLTPQIEKTYTAYKPNNTLADGEVFLGIQRDLPYNLFTHVGIAGAFTSQAGLSGQIWDDADPAFNNYIYGYHIQHGHVALKAKVFKDLDYRVLPWVSGSVGLGFNRSNGFYNTPIISEAVTQNNFGNYTQTSFTYTVGAGLQKIINQNFQAGIGYEFSDWGQSRLNAAPGQTIGTGLSLSNLYTNGLMFNITYTA